jgi:uncharacterized protein involved in type VI secretion and phage assembly
MSHSLFDLLHSGRQDAQPGGPGAERIYGVVVGIVTNNKDDDGMGRVKVKFPWLSDQDESWWARIATMMAGSSRGSYFLPEVNDEVLVAFEHGDVRFPYVVGALWNGQDAPPTTNSDGQNNIRVIKSRSGHIVRLDDTDGNEKIEVIDKTGNNSITIGSSDNSITITANGPVKIVGQSIEITSQTTINVSAQTEIDVTAQTSMTVKANATMDIESTAPMTIKGATVGIN